VVKQAELDVIRGKAGEAISMAELIFGPWNGDKTAADVRVEV
jgi:hypothetical protein